MSDIRFFNSLTHQTENFTSIEPDKVRLYTCGPTVYHYAHIGNLRTYIFEDVLRRMLEKSGYQVQHVMNITDVGHLESNADAGDDKMNLAAKRENKTPWEVAKFFEEAFFDDCKSLNILKPTVVCRATDHVQDMINLIKRLLDKEMAYAVDGNVYFNTSKFPTDSLFAKVDRCNSETHRRVERDPRKRNDNDFVLWFSNSKYPNQVMKWYSPWGEGFPGWHIECSAMAMKYLGDKIDIHCGGIDHIPIHHTNEIAQSEADIGSKWVNYWLHAEFLLLDKEKMAKSNGNFLTVKSLVDAGYDPIHFRYLCLTAHYKSQLKFSYESLDAARNAVTAMRNILDDWKDVREYDLLRHDRALMEPYESYLIDNMRNDLNTATTLSVVWDVLRNNQISKQGRYRFFDFANGFLGIFKRTIKHELTHDQEFLLEERAIARSNKDWKRADELRDILDALGIAIKDRPDGTDWFLKQKI